MENQLDRLNREYALDVVLCLDGTGSMGAPIRTIQERAEAFMERLIRHMNETGKPCPPEKVRAKLIVFRDYAEDGDMAMEESPFYRYGDPEERAKLLRRLRDVRAIGGGDPPENALEALYLALRADWAGDRFGRQIILLFTDAPALLPHDPDREDATGYPADMPADTGALQELYENGRKGLSYDPTKARLVACAPKANWDFMRAWERCLFIPVPGEGDAWDWHEIGAAFDGLLGGN